MGAQSQVLSTFGYMLPVWHIEIAGVMACQLQGKGTGDLRQLG
jgi:hypothetical protein